MLLLGKHDAAQKPLQGFQGSNIGAFKAKRDPSKARMKTRPDYSPFSSAMDTRHAGHSLYQLMPDRG